MKFNLPGGIISMEHEREKRFMALIRGLADMLGKEVSPELLKVYYFACKDISLADLEKAVMRYLNQYERPFFPTPGQLRAVLEPTPDAQAKDAAARIVEGISRIGPYDHARRAKEFVGELAWEVVKRMGGWQEICLTQADDLQSASAKWRELAKSIIEKDKLGIRDELPMLPSSREKLKQMSQLANVLPSMPIEKTN